MANPMLLPLLGWARKLRYPTLFKVTALVFVVNVFVPDMIPFVDEILLGLGTLLLANLKDRKGSDREPIEGEAGRTKPRR
ncbi:MAG: DUF6116 family protein [Lysobacter sp.]|uniref:DUF6116 family protein n=1 Tax=Lysobacter sp. F6437 TaxID=3459296 RepID=UPI003E092E71